MPQPNPLTVYVRFERLIEEGCDHLSRAVSLLALMMEINTPAFWLDR